MDNQWDPYEHLMDITKFCNRADEHINHLIKNQKFFVDSINEIKEDLQILKAKIDLVEQILENSD
jgi:hypothetical protein